MDKGIKMELDPIPCQTCKDPEADVVIHDNGFKLCIGCLCDFLSRTFGIGQDKPWSMVALNARGVEWLEKNLV